MYTHDKNEWTGYIVTHRKGNQIGLVATSLSLDRASTELTRKTLEEMGRTGETVRRVTVILEDD